MCSRGCICLQAFANLPDAGKLGCRAIAPHAHRGVSARRCSLLTKATRGARCRWFVSLAAEAATLGWLTRVLWLVLALVAWRLMPGMVAGIARAALTFVKLWLYNALHVAPLVPVAVSTLWLLGHYTSMHVPNIPRMTPCRAAAALLVSGAGVVAMNWLWHLAPVFCALWVTLKVVWVPMRITVLVVSVFWYVLPRDVCVRARVGVIVGCAVCVVRAHGVGGGGACSVPSPEPCSHTHTHPPRGCLPLPATACHWLRQLRHQLHT